MDTCSIQEAATALEIHHKVVRRLINQGRLTAVKLPGRHGPEWRVDTTSLESLKKEGMRSPDATVPSLSQPMEARTAPSSHPAHHFLEDKRFLQAQVERLTLLLGQALGQTLPPSETPVQAAVSYREVTEALQSALRSLDRDQVQALQFCSVRVLWGRPVLWRTETQDPGDVNSLLEALLSQEAAWDPPGEEVVYVYALSPSGEVLWGTACGPGWFGPAFRDRLREARVERR